MPSSNQVPQNGQRCVQTHWTLIFGKDATSQRWEGALMASCPTSYPQQEGHWLPSSMDPWALSAPGGNWPHVLYLTAIEMPSPSFAGLHSRVRERGRL